MKRTGNICVLFILVALFGCKKSNPQTAAKGFAKSPQNISITGGSIPEASGIADSRANPGYLWVEQDSGNPPDIYLLGHDGKIGKTIVIGGAINRDWEEMTIAAGPEEGRNYIYLGEIGDNNVVYRQYCFYRFEEPLMSVDTVKKYDKILFTFPDGSHDSEAFIVDAKTKDIYVITKNDSRSKVYRISYPQDTVNANNAVFVSDLAFNGVVSAAMSPDSRELIVKTYTTLYYYPRDPSETISATLARTPSTLGYQLEPQGEAVCFTVDNSGFYTLSEIRGGLPVTLNFYKRN